MIIQAKLYDGASSKEHIVDIEFTKDKRVLVKEFGINEPLSSVKIASRLGNTPRVIEFSNNIRCKSSQNDKIDSILSGLDVQISPIHKLEKSLKLAVGSVVMLAAFIIFMLTAGAGMSADVIANILPQNTLDRASKMTLKELDKGYLHKSNLSNGKKAKVLKLFKKLTNNDSHYKLHFRSSPQMGPNAFALPSGDIVIIDELVFLDKDPNLYGLLGVLAHEKGHYVYKHGLKSLIKGTLATAIVSYFTGDVSFIVTTLPTLLITSKYSRDNEREADSYAKKELNRLHISSKPLANIFRQMENYYTKKYGKDNSMPAFNWVASHPITEDRIKFFNQN
jgi:Zn-dependent protease with chaperone function